MDYRDINDSQNNEKVVKMVIIDTAVLIAEFRNLLNNGYIHIFVWMVVGDIASGIVKGLMNKEGNSTKGLIGAVKHLLVVALVLISYPYLKILGFESIATAFVCSYIAIYGISLVENWGQIGLPLPDFVKDRLGKLKDKSEEKGRGDKHE